MAQIGYVSCACCGRLYRDDGSEDSLYKEEHQDSYHPKDEQAMS
jgi:hypothetical protein